MSEDDEDDLLRELNDRIGGLIELDGGSYANGIEEQLQQDLDGTSETYKFNLFSRHGYQDIAIDRQVVVGDDAVVNEGDDTVYVIAERPMSYYFTAYDFKEILVELLLIVYRASEDRYRLERIKAAVIDYDQIIQESKVSWPACGYGGRVLHVSSSTEGERKKKQRKRPSKRRRAALGNMRRQTSVRHRTGHFRRQ